MSFLVCLRVIHTGKTVIIEIVYTVNQCIWEINYYTYFYSIFVEFLVWGGLKCDLAPGSKIGNYSEITQNQSIQSSKGYLPPSDVLFPRYHCVVFLMYAMALYLSIKCCKGYLQPSEKNRTMDYISLTKM